MDIIRQTNEYDIKLEYAKQRRILLEKYLNLNKLYVKYEEEKKTLFDEIKRIDRVLGNDFVWKDVE